MSIFFIWLKFRRDTAFFVNQESRLQEIFPISRQRGVHQLEQTDMVSSLTRRGLSQENKKKHNLIHLGERGLPHLLLFSHCAEYM